MRIPSGSNFACGAVTTPARPDPAVCLGYGGLHPILTSSGMAFSVEMLSKTFESLIGPMPGVLQLHQVTRSLGKVGSAAMPALMVGQINIAGLA